MTLQRQLKGLMMLGVKLTDVAEKTKINIHTLYSISNGRNTSKEKEEMIRRSIMYYYPEEIEELSKFRDLGFF